MMTRWQWLEAKVKLGPISTKEARELELYRARAEMDRYRAEKGV